jgi:hypothetical protein
VRKPTKARSQVEAEARSDPRRGGWTGQGRVQDKDVGHEAPPPRKPSPQPSPPAAPDVRRHTPHVTPPRTTPRVCPVRPAARNRFFRDPAPSPPPVHGSVGRLHSTHTPRANGLLTHPPQHVHSSGRPAGSLKDPLAAPSARSSTDRAFDYGSKGWGFESLRARPTIKIFPQVGSPMSFSTG